MRRKKRIISFGFKGSIPYISFIVFAAVYIIGVLIGTLSVGKVQSFFDYSKQFVDTYISVRQKDAFGDVLLNSVGLIAPYFIAVFLIGTSIIGFVITPLILLSKGVLFGIVSGYVYFTYKLEGIIFTLLLLIPSALATTVGLIVLSKEAFNFSFKLGSICLKTASPVSIASGFKTYYLQSAITLIPAFIGVALDILMSLLFIGFFNF